MKKSYIKIVLDLLMALTFALLMNPRVLNGLPFHEIAGLVIGVAILTHIGLNFSWVKNTTLKIFDSNLPKKARFSYLLNILLLVSMATVIITGILISRVVFPNLAIEGNHTIRELHNLSSNLTLAIVGLHIGVHWQWVMGVCKKMFKSKEGKFRKGVIASVLLSLAILAGGIQWFSSTASSNVGDDFRPQQFQQQGTGQPFDNGNTGFNSNTQGNNGDNISNFQGAPPNGDFRERHGDGEFGHRSSRSPFLIILNYFAIMAVIIIPAYFVEKRILKNRRKAKDTPTQLS